MTSKKHLNRILCGAAVALALVGCSDLPDLDDPRELVSDEQQSCRNFLVNGDFDDGPTSWGISSWDVIADENDYSQTEIYAHSGDYFAWLGGVYSSARSMEQIVDVPSFATGMTLKGKTIVGSEADMGPVEDTFKLEVLDYESRTVLGTPLSWTNQDPTSGTGWSWRDFRADIFGDHSGQTIVLRWTSVNDAQNNTNFLFDSLRLKKLGCP
jgi:hypothetical protein